MLQWLVFVAMAQHNVFQSMQAPLNPLSLSLEPKWAFRQQLLQMTDTFMLNSQ